MAQNVAQTETIQVIDLTLHEDTPTTKRAPESRFPEGVESCEGVEEFLNA